MNTKDACVILETLMDRINPITGELLPEDHVCQEPVRRLSGSEEKGAQKMKVVTFNIRGDFGVDGENDFRFRKPLIEKKLRAEQPDLIGFQEVMPHMAAWLREILPGYTVVGCGRGEIRAGVQTLGGEQMTVAFRTDRYNLIEMRTFWLSPEPWVPGSRYAVQSSCPRTATELLLMEYATGKVIRVLNTHLDHEGAPARMLGLRQVLTHLASAVLFPEAPVILMGDFNAEPDSPEMQVFAEYPDYANATAGIGATFHAFGRAEAVHAIDYIFLKGGIRCASVTKWTDQEQGVYLSDHYPVCAEVQLH